MIVSDLEGEKLAYQTFIDEPVGLGRRRDRRHAAVVGMTFTLVLAVTLVLMTLLYLGIQAKVNRTSYLLNDLKMELQTLKKENDLLNLKIAELKSLERIEREAIEKLGMRKPDKTRVLSMNVYPTSQSSQESEASSDPAMAPERVKLAQTNEIRRTVQKSILAAFSQLTVRWFSSSSAYSGD